jgi:hypothetical protein
MSAVDKTVVAPREGWFSRLMRLRRGPWEAIATAVIAAGVIMLMQSWSIALYSWSFVTVLVGTALFVVVSHFRD